MTWSLIFLLIVFAVVVLPGSCPQGWIGYGGSCYLPYVHGKTWQEANETCREMDSHLALSKSADENEFIAVEVGRPESRVWIGLRRTEGEFVWSDGSKADFTNWPRNEPKSGKDCVSLLPEDIFYSWEVTDCDERQAFICERGKIITLFNTLETQSSFTTHDLLIKIHARRISVTGNMFEYPLVDSPFTRPNQHTLIILSVLSDNMFF